MIHKKSVLISLFIISVVFTMLSCSSKGDELQTAENSFSINFGTSLPTITPLVTAEPTPAPTTVPVLSFSKEETYLYGDPVYPMLFPGNTDDNTGCVIVSWLGYKDKNVDVCYAVDDGRGSLPDKYERVRAKSEKLKHIHAFHTTHQYSAELNLNPDTRYVYGLAEEDEIPKVLYIFTSGRLDSSSVLFVSDSHLANNEQTQVLESVVERALDTSITDPLDRSGLDLVLSCGDLMESPNYYQGCVAETMDSFRSVPFASVIGNHDSSKTLLEFIRVPNCDTKLGDFWFVQGGVLYIGLHSGQREYKNQHAAFLRKAVEESGDHNWTVLLLHYSMQSDGSHRVDGPVISYRTVLEPIISELDIDLVISGHDHEYNRSGLIGENGLAENSTGDSICKKAGEAVYITLPAATLYKFYDISHRLHTPSCYPLAAGALEEENGFVLADFTDTAVAIRAYGMESGLVDSFVMTKE